MGQVVPFIARVRDSGDWTAAERARLQELADRLAAGGVDVEVIFGATDEGDPWCVVTDGNGDVLIHVARIDGEFVVHSAVDDARQRGRRPARGAARPPGRDRGGRWRRSRRPSCRSA